MIGYLNQATLVLIIPCKDLPLFLKHGSIIFCFLVYSAAPPQLHILSQCYIPPLSHCFFYFTHLYPLFLPWKCQLNGAGLVSSASSRALVSTKGWGFMCVHVCIICPPSFPPTQVTDSEALEPVMSRN